MSAGLESIVPGDALRDFINQGFTRMEAFTLVRDMMLTQMGVTSIGYGLPSFDYSDADTGTAHSVPTEQHLAVVTALQSALTPYLTLEDISRITEQAIPKYCQGEARD